VSCFTIPEIDPDCGFLQQSLRRLPSCGGLGVEQHIDEELGIPAKELTLRPGAIAPCEISVAYSSQP